MTITVVAVTLIATASLGPALVLPKHTNPAVEH